MKEIDKKDWDEWVDACPIRDLCNAFSGTAWMTFKSAKSFKEWLNNIPIFKENKEE